MDKRRDTAPDLVTVPKARLRELDDLANTLIMELDSLDQIRRELGQVYKKLAATTAMRSSAHALKRLLNELDATKTPVRPPSNEAWDAFRQSSEFVSPVAQDQSQTQDQKKRPPPLPRRQPDDKEKPGPKKGPGRY